MTVKSPVGMSRRTQPRSHTAMAFRIDDPVGRRHVHRHRRPHAFDPHRPRRGGAAACCRSARNSTRGRMATWPTFRRARAVGAAQPAGRRSRLALVQRGLRHARSRALWGDARPAEGAGLSHRHWLQRLGHQQRHRGRHHDRGLVRRLGKSLGKPLRSGAAVPRRISTRTATANRLWTSARRHSAGRRRGHRERRREDRGMAGRSGTLHAFRQAAPTRAAPSPGTTPTGPGTAPATARSSQPMVLSSTAPPANRSPRRGYKGFRQRRAETNSRRVRRLAPMGVYAWCLRPSFFQSRH